MSLRPTPVEVTRLDPKTRQLLDATTADVVNLAIDRRFQRIVDASAAADRVGQRFWPIGLACALGVLLASLAWLLLGGSH